MFSYPFTVFHHKLLYTLLRCRVTDHIKIGCKWKKNDTCFFYIVLQGMHRSKDLDPYLISLLHYDTASLFKVNTPQCHIPKPKNTHPTSPLQKKYTKGNKMERNISFLLNIGPVLFMGPRNCC